MPEVPAKSTSMPASPIRMVATISIGLSWPSTVIENLYSPGLILRMASSEACLDFSRMWVPSRSRSSMANSSIISIRRRQPISLQVASE